MSELQNDWKRRFCIVLIQTIYGIFSFCFLALNHSLFFFGVYFRGVQEEAEEEQYE